MYEYEPMHNLYVKQYFQVLVMHEVSSHEFLSFYVQISEIHCSITQLNFIITRKMVFAIHSQSQSSYLVDVI